MTPVWVIILTWNNYHDTRECIKSLKESTYSAVRLLVVDNGSNDGSVGRLQSDYEKDGSIHFIRNEFNYGFARGVNVGIRYALAQGAELIMLVNNDAVIDKECIQQLLGAVLDRRDVGLAGPRIFYYRDRTRVWQGGGYYNWLKTGIINPEKSKAAPLPCGLKDVTFLTGCVMLIRREVFERIGFFDEDYFFYEEDVDFCLRALRAGFRLLYVPTAQAWHKIASIAADRTSPFVLYHLARSRIIFLRKNFSRFYLLYGLLVHMLFYTPFRCLQVLRGSRSLKAVVAWFEGTWVGLREPVKHGDSSQRCGAHCVARARR